MTTFACSRRSFIQTAGLAVAALPQIRVLGAAPMADPVQLGMMLQGNSVADLKERARAIAGAGFTTVQLNFFFEPTEAEVESLGSLLRELKLKTAAIGTYFNLFRPDDAGFMGANLGVMKRVAAHAALFDCRQFVTWSASHSPRFDGSDPRNQSPDAVAQLVKAVRELVLPVLEPIAGRVAFEPYYRHVFGTLDAARSVLKSFPVGQVGMVLDPPNFISPELYAKRDDEMRRLFRELGERVFLAHFKDLKLAASGDSVDYPAPGGGVMDYAQLIAGIRGLGRPVPCILEHFPARAPELTQYKSWVEEQMKRPESRAR